MNRGRVSVVLPTFDRAGLVRVAVDSVLAQTYEDIELIVVDDGSADETLSMLAAYRDPRLRVLAREHSGILGRMNNAALEIATGEFIALIDSDDVWLPGKIERQIRVLVESPDVGLVCSNAHVVNDRGDDLGYLYLPVDSGASGAVLEQLLDANFVIRSSAVMRRTLVEDLHGFSEAPELRTTDDYDMWLRIAALSDVVYLREALLGYREHAGSVRKGFPRSTYWQALLISLDNLEGVLAAGSDASRLVKGRRAEWLLRLALAQRHDVGLRLATHTAISALSCDPLVVPSLLHRAGRRRVTQVQRAAQHRTRSSSWGH